MKLSLSRIGTRLMIAFGAILALMVGTVAIGSRSVATIAASTRALTDTVFPKVVMPSDLENDVNDVAIITLAAQLSGQKDAAKAVEGSTSPPRPRSSTACTSRIDPLVHNPPGKRLLRPHEGREGQVPCGA